MAHDVTTDPTLDLPMEWGEGLAGVARRIYVNRSLNLENIHLVGFDMDYTLAIYNKREIEELAFDLTVKLLVTEKGYPTELLDLRYDPAFVIRGLLVDKARGNLVKMDRFKVVGRANHGTRPLSQEEVHQIYQRAIDQSDRNFVSIDTIFSLPEAYLFACLVDWADQHPNGLAYDRIFDDIKLCIDRVHNDGSLKGQVARDVPRYIYKDPYLALTLDELRSNGRRLFLLTNSYWEYTNLVMSYLLENELPGYASWRDYFDFVVVGARKPDFFTADAPFLHLEVESGELAEWGEPVAPGRVYQHGNAAHFTESVGLQGKEILYVGDHIFGDILRCHKNGGWRTTMIIQELEEELLTSSSLRQKRQQLRQWEETRQKLDSDLLVLSHKLKKMEDMLEAYHGHSSALMAEAVTHEIARLRETMREQTTRLGALVGEIAKLEQAIDQAYHPRWGMTFQETNEISRFGDQIRDYACTYTSRVSNFLLYPPDYGFKSVRERMPHERL